MVCEKPVCWRIVLAATNPFRQCESSPLHAVKPSSDGIAARCSCSLISRLDDGLLGDEDTVEELTLVLATDSAHLLDLRAAQGEGSVVNSIEDELTLLFRGERDLGTTLHLDDLVLLASQEVLDSDIGAVLGDDDVDGEMRVDESHLVAEALQVNGKGERAAVYN